jgi:hypothetical protein
MNPILQAKILAELIGTFALVYMGANASAQRAEIAICASRAGGTSL